MATHPRPALVGALLLLAVTLTACGSSATATPPTAIPPTPMPTPQVAADVALEPMAATLLAVSRELHGGSADLQYASDALGVQLTQSAQINTTQAQEYFTAAGNLLRTVRATDGFAEIARLLAQSHADYASAGKTYQKVVAGSGGRRLAGTEIANGRRLLAQADALLAARPETKLAGVQGSAAALYTSALQAATPRIVHHVTVVRKQKQPRAVPTPRPWASPTPVPVVAVVVRSTPTATVAPVPPTPLPAPRPVISRRHFHAPQTHHQAPRTVDGAPHVIHPAQPAHPRLAVPTATPTVNPTAVALLAQQRAGLLTFAREIHLASGRLARAERRIAQATVSADYDPVMLAEGQADILHAAARLRLVKRGLDRLTVAGSLTPLQGNLRQSIASDEGAAGHLRQAVQDAQNGAPSSLSADLSGALSALGRAGTALQATRTALQHAP